jgi:hypothetical protein
LIIKYGKPRSGTLNGKYRSNKQAYTTRIRECQQQQDYVYTNDLHEALISKREDQRFGNAGGQSLIRKLNKQVDGHVNDKDIVVNSNLFF